MHQVESFWKMKSPKRVKSNLNFGMPKLGKYPRRTVRENRIIAKNPYGDVDKDKVMNWYDCRPSIRKKQDFLPAVTKKTMKRYGGQIQKEIERLTPRYIQSEQKREEIFRKWGKHPETMARKIRQLGQENPEMQMETTGLFDFLTFPGVKNPLAATHKFYQTPGDEPRLIVDKGVVKGEVVFKQRGKGVREIKSMYILPEYRKQGVGKRVIESAFRKPETKRVIGVAILPSKKFWEKSGAQFGYPEQPGSSPEEMASIREMYARALTPGMREDEPVVKAMSQSMDVESLPEEVKKHFKAVGTAFRIEKEEFEKVVPNKRLTVPEKYLSTRGPLMESKVHGQLTGTKNVEFYEKPLRYAGKFKDLFAEGQKLQIRNPLRPDKPIVRKLELVGDKVKLDAMAGRENKIEVSPGTDIYYEEWKGPPGIPLHDRGSYLFIGGKDVPPGLRGQKLKLATEGDILEITGKFKSPEEEKPMALQKLPEQMVEKESETDRYIREHADELLEEEKKINEWEEKQEAKYAKEKAKELKMEETKLKRDIQEIKRKEKMEAETKGIGEARATWSGMTEPEKMAVGKRIAKESELPEYMHERVAKEIISSFDAEASNK